MARDRKIQFRRGTATEWTSANPILAEGELGYETDTNKGKFGDGVTAWASLPYVTNWGSGGGGGSGFTQEEIEDFVGGMVTGNTESLITVTYQDIDGTLDFVVDNNLANYDNATSGFITNYTVTEGDVTAHQAALIITESQISDLASYITASSVDTLTNKSGAISQWTNDSGYITSYAETDTLQTVTDRGAITTNTVTLSPSGNNDALVANGSGSGSGVSITHAGGGVKLDISTTGAGDLINAGTFIVDSSSNVSANNLSGTNTGDQDLSGLQPLSTVLTNTTASFTTALEADITANTAKVSNATHTGDVTGSTTLTIASGAVDIANLSATGTASSSTFLRGDNTWATPAGGGGSSVGVVQSLNSALASTTVASNQAFNGTHKLSWQAKQVGGGVTAVTVSGSQWSLDEGEYLVSVNCNWFALGARSNVGIQIAADTAGGTSYTGVSPKTQTGYIRAANGHNEAGGVISNFAFEVGSGNTTTFEVWIGNTAAIDATSFTIDAGQASISILKTS